MSYHEGDELTRMEDEGVQDINWDIESEGDEEEMEAAVATDPACCMDPCESMPGSAMLTLPCGHTIHNSCLYVKLIRAAGKVETCPSCGDNQLATLCSIVASAKNACTVRRPDGSTYVTAATAPAKPGTDLHHLSKRAAVEKQRSLQRSAGYGAPAPAANSMPGHLKGGYGNKLSGVSASYARGIQNQSAYHADQQHGSRTLDQVHAQQMGEFEANRARGLTAFSKRAQGTRLNGSMARGW
ncbi:putative RING finger protein [Acanthamoeba castellanii medusavirus]|uniref:RING finger protein n=1 Tax=Acanthamoeba castellanii medusavirus J1 TaxID=3114988 RepID=A0A3T1CX55_9VIRU|nr:putative RING finger protein [Acanthamoeba castellanii medusavirus]BBI30385.1 putative RING finger protein [Acanthamoeba castellanii medusavirus J1]